MSDNQKIKSSIFYERGKTNLLSGELYTSLKNYAKGLQTSQFEQEILEALKSVNGTHNNSKGFDLVQRLLMIGLAAKFGKTDNGKAALKEIKKLASPFKPFTEPIVIVAGGCSVEVEAKIHEYKKLILDAFSEFKGTIISGGTTSGISGLVGEVQKEHPNIIRTVGYVPNAKIDCIDNCYNEIRFTISENFSFLEPLQYWIDIISSDIRAPDIKLLGVNGGRISAVEYRIAIALGARTGIIEDSGMEADKILLDKDWNTQPNLLRLPNNSKVVRSFLLEKAADT
jgi:hypothetical protein